MPKFVTNRDWEFFQHINDELFDDVIDVIVILYKPHMESTVSNVYGEGTEKTYWEPVEVKATIEYPANTAETDRGFGVDQRQNPIFRFVRRMLQNKDVFPEVGDFIEYNDLYYEIDNVQSVQLVGSRPEYNEAIVCTSHLTRRSTIRTEPRQL